MSKLALDVHGAPIPVIYPGASQSVAYTGTSAQSNALSSTVVRIVATTDCFLAFGNDPTATTSDMFMPASAIEYLAVYSGSKIAAIQSASGGTLYITEAN